MKQYKDEESAALMIQRNARRRSASKKVKEVKAKQLLAIADNNVDDNVILYADDSVYYNDNNWMRDQEYSMMGILEKTL